MATISESFTRMREDFDRAHQERQEMIRGLQAEVRNQAAQTAGHLAEQTKNRLEEFHSQMNHLRTEVRGQAARTREFLADFSADLHRGGAVFQGRASRKGGRGSR